MDIISLFPSAPFEYMALYFHFLCFTAGCFEFRHTSGTLKGYKRYMLSEEPLLTVCVRGSMLRTETASVTGTYSDEKSKAGVGLLYRSPVYILIYKLDDLPSLYSVRSHRKQQI